MSDASSSSGPFARRAPGLATGRDHFREQAERKAAKKGAPKGDAFAGGAATVASYYDPFKPKPRAPEPRAPEPRSESARAYEDFRAELAPPPPRHVLSNGAELKVFERDDETDALMRVEEKFEQKKIRRSRQGAKSSSLVLVSQSNVVAAAAPVVEAGGQDEVVIPASEPSKAREARRSGSGGGGTGGGGGGRKPPPQIDRAFNQDDLVAVLLVLALLLLLGLYLVRGGGAPQEPERLLSTQFAATQPVAPPGPPPDPYGDKPIDLTPPAPAAPPPITAAPAPAAAACPSSQSLRAWFCTDKSDLTDAAKAALDRDLEQWSQCFADRELVVSGYADTRGPEIYNSWLGEMRASTVAAYLRGKGVKVAQLTGVGELSGLDDNQDCSNQRRVDIMFSGETEEPSRSCAPPQEVANLVCG